MSTSLDLNLSPGDWVEVRSAPEIAQTLDANGTLHGLPFMPEMQVYCGQRFRLSQKAFKACVEVECSTEPLFIDIRAFHHQDVWVLEELRCSGQAHDGCQRGCLLFWKTAWLRQVEAPTAAAPSVPEDQALLCLNLKTKTAPKRYFCQSTELANATRPISRWGRLRLCVDEVRAGNVSVYGMIKRMMLPVFWKMMNQYIKPRYVVGHLKRTPLVKLDLQPGELVKVKSAEEIKTTLNKKGCNRGLRYDHGLNQFCGSRFRVRNRLDQMIIESTGQMIQLEGTVTLERSSCLCHMSALGGCPRLDLVYWREAWLERDHGEEVTTRER